MGKVVVEAIKEHLRTYGDHEETGLLITTDIAEFPPTSTLHGAFQRAARAAGTDVTPHDYAGVRVRPTFSEDVWSRALIDAELGSSTRAPAGPRRHSREQLEHIDWSNCAIL